MERKPITPPHQAYGLTKGQIDKLVGIFRAMIEKHHAEFNSALVQTVLDQADLGPDLLAVFSQHVEAVVGLVMRRARVDPRFTLGQMFDGTSRKKHLNHDVIETMPRGDGKSQWVYFFRPGRPLTDQELEKEYGAHHLKPVDPYLLAQVNTDEPDFAHEYPNGTHWYDISTGKWCFAIFFWGGSFGRKEDVVIIDVSGESWADYWWFAGVRDDQ